MDHMEDNNSTSASGSDSEVDLILSGMSTSTSDSEVDTMPGAPPVPPPPNFGGKVAGEKVTVSGWVGQIAEFLRCARRSPQVDSSCTAVPALKYERNILLQFRPTPSSQGLHQGLLPRTMSLQQRGALSPAPQVASARPLSQDAALPMDPLPAHHVVAGDLNTLWGKCLPKGEGAPSLSLPPGLSLPAGFTPPPGLTAPTVGETPTPVRARALKNSTSRNNVGTAVGRTTAQAVGVKRPSTPPAKEVRPQAKPVANLPAEPEVRKVYNAREFHKEIVVILRELASDWNVGNAVRRVRAENVPQESQAAEFADILTRSAEERRGVTRRLCFAFAAGLGAAESSAFEKSECFAGVHSFFQDVYPDLCEEVPRLRSIIAHELVPTLRSVFPARELSSLLPEELRTA